MPCGRSWSSEQTESLSPSTSRDQALLQGPGSGHKPSQTPISKAMKPRMRIVSAGNNGSQRLQFGQRICHGWKKVPQPLQRLSLSLMARTVGERQGSAAGVAGDACGIAVQLGSATAVGCIPWFGPSREVGLLHGGCDGELPRGRRSVHHRTKCLVHGFIGWKGRADVGC